MKLQVLSFVAVATSVAAFPASGPVATGGAMATRQFDQPSTGATSGGDGSDPFCLDQDPDEGSARGDGYAGVYPTQAILTEMDLV